MAVLFSSRTLRLLASLIALCASAAGDTWYGLVPGAPGSFAVSLVTLSDSAQVLSAIGSVQLGANERAWPDGFRCIRGFCLFPTTTFAPPSPLPLFSTVYNVSSADAAVFSRARCGTGFCRDMHVDYASGAAYLLSVEEQATTVVRVAGGKLTPVADITAAVGNGDIDVGQTTHCSEVGPAGHFYVGVDFFGEAADYVLSVDLATRKVDKTTTLAAGLQVPSALWAKCDGSGQIGGVAFAAAGAGGGNGTATFVTIDAAGNFERGDAVGVPGGAVPSGMLAGSFDAAHFVAAFFSEAAVWNASAAKGWLWAISPYGGSDDAVSRVDTFLIGAAFDAAGAAATARS